MSQQVVTVLRQQQSPDGLVSGNIRRFRVNTAGVVQRRADRLVITLCDAHQVVATERTSGTQYTPNVH
jgi:hypothetical protein